MAFDFSMEWAPPAVAAFTEKAKELLIANGPDHVHSLATEFENVFCDIGVLRALSNEYLTRVLNGKADDGDVLIGSDALQMAYSSTMTLRMIKDRTDITSFGNAPKSEVLVNYPSNTLLFTVTKEPIAVDWYRLADGADFDRFDASLNIEHESTTSYPTGSVIYVDARKRFPVLPARPGDLYIALSGAAVNSQIVSFEPVTLKPLGASISSNDSSVLCVMLDLLDPRHAPYPLDAIMSLVAHPDHQVRWAATTALGKHSRSAALKVIKDLAINDSHQFIRSAAERTLRQNEAVC